MTQCLLARSRQLAETARCRSTASLLLPAPCLSAFSVSETFHLFMQGCLLCWLNLTGGGMEDVNSRAFSSCGFHRWARRGTSQGLGQECFSGVFAQSVWLLLKLAISPQSRIGKAESYLWVVLATVLLGFLSTQWFLYCIKTCKAFPCNVFIASPKLPDVFVMSPMYV